MTTTKIKELSADNEIIISCAFNFPCFVKYYGQTNWEQLNDALLELASNNYKVRKIVGLILHELAKVIGQKNTKKDLVPLLEMLLNDRIDSVRLSAVKNLTEFIELFDNKYRQQLLDVFQVIQNDPKKWR